MAASSTYTPIATTTLGSAAASYTFSSISGSYTDLVLIINGTTTTNGASLTVRFNSDSGSNYSLTQMRGTGSSAVSSRGSSLTSLFLGYSAGISSTEICNAIMQIQNYSNATTYKTAISRINNANGSLGAGTEANVGLWRNTNAITSIVVAADSGNLNTGISLTLYGIAAA